MEEAGPKERITKKRVVVVRQDKTDQPVNNVGDGSYLKNNVGEV